jgi:hypothetical protein
MIARGAQANIAQKVHYLHHAVVIVQHPSKAGMPTAKKKHRRKMLASRIRVVMAERGVHSIAELLRRVEAVGLKVSKHQLARFVDGNTAFWDPEIIESVMTVLDCELSDLWDTTITTKPFSDRREGKSKMNRKT